MYTAFAVGKPSPLSELPIQYADFAQWQNEWMDGGRIEKELSYWREQLAGAPPALDLPTDRSRPAVQTTRGARRHFALSPSLVGSLKKLRQREGATLYMVLLAAFQVLLLRYSGHDDISVGTPVAGRNHAETQGLIGLFLNTLVMRVRMDGNPTFRGLLKRVKQNALAAYAHQELPFEKVVEGLQPERDLSRSPLFQVMFIMQVPAAGSELSGLEMEVLAMEPGTSKFELTLFLAEMKGALEGYFEYNTDLFDAATIERMEGHLRTLLEAIAVDPEQRIGDLPLLTAAERRHLLVDWNDTARTTSSDCCLHELFEAQVERSPDAVAVVFENQQLTYAELNHRANQLAHYLRGLEAGPDKPVGLLVERSLEMAVGLLGILKAGAAYVPLDPAFPVERTLFMLRDAGARVLLTQDSLRAAYPTLPTKLVCLDGDWPVIAAAPIDNPPRAATPENLAYIIYTSGSTGKPKGVMVEHRSVVNLLESMRREPGLSSGDVLLAVTTLSFDIAGLELYLPLICGARVEVVNHAVAIDGGLLQQQLRRSGATVMQATPATWSMLIESGWQGDNSLNIFCGGEALSAELGRELLRRARSVWNMYGPTETTIWSTVYRLKGNESGVVGIGRPIANTHTRILDRQGNLAPVGVAGELLIGGAGVGRGYWQRPELTAEKFIHDPFDEQGRLYRTGDLARWRADGTLDYLGRMDHQVKVRGYRIELGEVETVLADCPGVRQSVVVVRQDEPGDARLVAYIVSQSEAALDPGELRRRLRQCLPEYMVPSAFIPLERLPLTPNGKVDRKALPAPGQTRLEPRASSEPPKTEMEKTIAAVWKEVLRVDRIGRQDNFFDLGGHSLLLTQVHNRLCKVVEKDLTIINLFRFPTVAGLAAYLSPEAQAATSVKPYSVPEIRRRARENPRPLSFPQERLWFFQQLAPQNPAYNVIVPFRLLGGLDCAVLKRSLQEIVRRHEMLRTRFVASEGRPMQVVAESQEVDLRVMALDKFEPKEREQQVVQLLTEDAQKPFDLENGPLFRARVFRLKADQHVLQFTMHHIVSDGWSVGLLLREIRILYDAYIAGQDSPLPELPIQYGDFTEWQREYLQGDVLEEKLGYWRKQLAGELPALNLPTDHQRPALQGSHGAQHSIRVPREVTDQLKALSSQLGSTLFMTLLAAFNVLLTRYCGQDDILVGTPIANRLQVATEDLIGAFLNTLVLRTDTSGNPSFLELLERVKQVSLGAYAHQDLPFEKLVEELRPGRDLSRSPLFQVMFVLQNAPMEKLQLSGLRLEPVEVQHGVAKFDLTLWMAENEHGLVGSLEYNTELFETETITRMGGHLERLFEGIARHPEQRIWQLPLHTGLEHEQMVVNWNRTHADYPRHLCVYELIAEHARREPNDIAVEYHGRKLSYGELEGRSNQFARRLERMGVRPGDLVGLCVSRSEQMVTALLGILKAGAAYVPMDPDYPTERLRFMLEDSAARILVIEQEQKAQFLEYSGECLILDADWSSIAEEAAESLESVNNPQGRAYVIYTSGSTGKPKGVEIEHRALVNFLWSMRTKPGMTRRDVLLAITTLSFDIAGLELYLPLIVGARTVIASREEILDARTISDLLVSSRATVMQATPAMWRMLVEAGWGNSELKVLCGGEALSRELATQLLRRSRSVWNMYGPTETTVWSALHQITSENEDPIVIGRPIANTQFYILDRALNPVPVGVPGELHIGGVGVALGYHNRPELTAQKFIADPFSEDPHARLYKTGDLARYLPDGNVEFLGRIDHQVKIRGYRIELEEIESILREHSSIKDCVVLAREDTAGDKRLIAYFIGKQGSEVSIGELRACLQQKLPTHMLPTAFVALSAFPLTPNGKIDRKALPTPDEARPNLDVPYAPPRDEVEKAIASLWQGILHVEHVGREDNFFDLGGHSLLMVQAHSAMRKSFSREISVVDMFRYPTVRSLAQHLAHGPKTKLSFEKVLDRASIRREAMNRQRQSRLQR